MLLIRAFLHGRFFIIQLLCRVPSAQNRETARYLIIPTARASALVSAQNARAQKYISSTKISTPLCTDCWNATRDWLKAPNSSPTPASCQSRRQKAHENNETKTHQKAEEDDVPRPLVRTRTGTFRGAVMEVCCAFLRRRGGTDRCRRRPANQRRLSRTGTHTACAGRGVTTPSGREARTREDEGGEGEMLADTVCTAERGERGGGEDDTT
ncbi:hypothetical protein V8C26DRAFT_403734, partial [Trichoderma gracile]